MRDEGTACSRMLIESLLIVATYLKDSRAENSTVRSLRSASASKSPPHSGEVGVSSSGILLRRTLSDSCIISRVVSHQNVT